MNFTFSISLDFIININYNRQLITALMAMFTLP